ncbi:Uncharacterised protein [Mycobacteroides abscessus subsp. abscessus]|nr:Uncharacterised protein [Mycobacteroides abscessus subsp. abscessus]
MRVKPIRTGVRYRELVVEYSRRCDLRLGEAGHAVHVIAQRQAVPMNTRRRREIVDGLYPENFALAQADFLPGYPAPVCPGGYSRADEIEFGGAGVQGELADGSSLPSSCRFHRGDAWRIRIDALRCGSSRGVFGAGGQEPRSRNRHTQTEELASAKPW